MKYDGTSKLLTHLSLFYCLSEYRLKNVLCSVGLTPCSKVPYCTYKQALKADIHSKNKLYDASSSTSGNPSGEHVFTSAHREGIIMQKYFWFKKSTNRLQKRKYGIYRQHTGSCIRRCVLNTSCATVTQKTWRCREGLSVVAVSPRFRFQLVWECAQPTVLDLFELTNFISAK